MEVFYITWDIDDHHRWCVTCPSLPILEQDERTEWCEQLGIDFVNHGVRWWFAEEKDVILFKLRWA